MEFSCQLYAPAVLPAGKMPGACRRVGSWASDIARMLCWSCRKWMAVDRWTSPEPSHQAHCSTFCVFQAMGLLCVQRVYYAAVWLFFLFQSVARAAQSVQSLDYGLDDSDIRTPAGEIFETSRAVLCPIQLSNKWIFFLGSKWAGAWIWLLTYIYCRD
jgi:hypothetical protein